MPHTMTSLNSPEAASSAIKRTAESKPTRRKRMKNESLRRCRQLHKVEEAFMRQSYAENDMRIKELEKLIESLEKELGGQEKVQSLLDSSR